MLRRISEIRNILRIEPEWCLHYLAGQKSAELKHLHDVAPGRLKGPLLKTLWFIVRPWLKEKKLWSQSSPIEKAKYFVYACTGNQMKSLIGFVEALSEKGESCQFVSQDKLIAEHAIEEHCVPYAKTVSDVAVSQVVAVLGFLRLNRGLSYLPDKIRDGQYSNFLSAYVYLAVFLRILREVRPEYVVVSNDHSPGPRCLVAAAHYLGIKTVYMQHASVCNIFPALRFNYAFLDGEKSLRVYEECENNSPADIKLYPKPVIFLSGQKKKLYIEKNNLRKKIGIAINMLDSINNVVDVINKLTKNGFSILLRWHPNQSLDDIAKINTVFENNSKVGLSNPKSQDVSAFLGESSSLIAGNSSIHLEAAIMGVKTIYYEMAPSERPDYYGYVREGISVFAETIDDIFAFIYKNECANLEERYSAIKRYSETYGTIWHGREGELVAETLQRISIRKELLPIYKSKLESNVFGAVYINPASK